MGVSRNDVREVGVLVLIAQLAACRPQGDESSVTPEGPRTTTRAAPMYQACPAEDVDCWIGDEDEVAAARERAFERDQNEQTRQQLSEQHEQTMAGLAKLAPESIEPSAWWCMHGSFQGEAVGACRHTSEECVELVVKAAERGVDGAAACERPSAVWCYGSVRVVDEKRISRCFPSAPSCDRDRLRIEARDEWRDVSKCAEIR